MSLTWWLPACALSIVPFAAAKQNKLRRYIGYCPQEDALLDLLTVRRGDCTGHPSIASALLRQNGGANILSCLLAAN